MKSTLDKLRQTQQPESTGAWAVYPFDKSVADKFRLTDKFDNPYQLYRVKNGKLLLPRAVCPIGKKDNRAEGYKVVFDLLHPPRNDEQDRVIVETYEFLQKGQSGIVECPTGFGKTYCACAVTALMQVPTMVVVTKEDLFEQWVEAAHEFLGLPYSKIGIVRQNKCSVGSKPFSVGMVHSLAKEGKYPEWLHRHFGLVHFDEVHRLPAEEFSKVAGFFASKWRVGWSATPYRSDGREVVFKAHIGPVRVVSEMAPMIPEVYRYWSTYELPMVYRKDPDTGKTAKVKLPHMFGKTGGVLKYMVKDQSRNLLIAKLASMCYKSGRTTVLFSDIREHLEDLMAMVVANGVKPSDIGFYVGGLKKEQKAEAKAKRFIFATYGFMKEGSDIPALDACIMATPKSEIKQIVGRVLRSLDGKKTPIVIDIIDTDSHVFAAYSEKRLRTYEALGAKVKDMD